jgi:hypothetical protein
MPDVPAAAHAKILGVIHGAQAIVGARRRATKVKTGYTGFDLVERTLAECHAAISGERDQTRVVKLLKTAAGALALVGGGDVAPAVERTRKRLHDILQALEAKDSNNG